MKKSWFIRDKDFVLVEYAILAVSDNGCAMDFEMLVHRFEPFFTTKEMGLAMVYGIVQQIMLMTNIVTPGLNGCDLDRLLLARYPDLKYLFRSGDTANVIAQHGVLDGAISFLQMPFSWKTLAKKVREALEENI